MIVAIPVDADGQVAHGWGRAPKVAVARTVDGAIVDWQVHDVGWDVAHDTGTEGSHHARIARFLRENGVETVVAGHMGDGMVRMLSSMRVPVVLGAQGDARARVLEAMAHTAG